MIATIQFVAESPIVHAGFGAPVGNAVLVRRLRLPSLPGSPRVACVSGNALRGICRRILMRELLGAAGVTRESLPGAAWDRLYGAIVNGGHLDNSETVMRPDAIRELRTSLPPLSVLGAALYSWMLPGHVSFGILWPRCVETIRAGVVMAGDEDVRAEDLVDEVSQVRHVDREHQDPQVSGVTPMPVTMEAIAPGTVLESRLLFADHASDLERSAIGHALASVTCLGGKSGSGFGRVRLASPPPDPQPYREWLAGHVDSARDALVRLASGLGPSTAAKQSRRARPPASPSTEAGDQPAAEGGGP